MSCRLLVFVIALYTFFATPAGFTADKPQQPPAELKASGPKTSEKNASLNKPPEPQTNAPSATGNTPQPSAQVKGKSKPAASVKKLSIQKTGHGVSSTPLHGLAGRLLGVSIVQAYSLHYRLILEDCAAPGREEKVIPLSDTLFNALHPLLMQQLAAGGIVILSLDGSGTVKRVGFAGENVSCALVSTLTGQP